MQQKASNDDACPTAMIEQRATGTTKSPGMKKVHGHILVSTPSPTLMGIESRASGILHKCSTTELQS